jgi:phage baseplate assembly protein V
MNELVYDPRAMIRHAKVAAVNDSGGLQTVDVVTDEGGTYSAIPVMQIWGHASMPPLDGLNAVLLCVGGDPANMRAIVYSSARRLGGLALGESVVYGNNGARIAFRQGGTVDVLAGTVVNIGAPNVTINATVGLTISAPIIAIEGNITVDGDIAATGTIHADGGVS